MCKYRDHRIHKWTPLPQRMNLEGPRATASFGFIYASYGPLFWWYENFETGRKLFMTGTPTSAMRRASVFACA